MHKSSDRIYPGATFSKLTVIERLPKEMGKHRYIYRVRCKCECGNEATPEVCALLRGNSTSCGCLKRTAGARAKMNGVKPGVGYGKILPGAVIGRLTIVGRIFTEDGKATNKVLCNCSCGKQGHLSQIDGLVNGTKSCGCLNTEAIAKRNKLTAKWQSFSTKHPTTMNNWKAMMVRCYSPKNASYQYYGAKGVRVCEYLWNPNNLCALIGIRPQKNSTLDRYPIHNGNYTCGQCDECKRNGWALNIRWASRKEQALNRGDFNVYLEAFGQRLTRSQWEELSGINEDCVRRRLKRGWTIEKALTVPDKFGHCYDPTTQSACILSS